VVSPTRIDLGAVLLASTALLLAGCGGGSSSPGVARVSSGPSGAGGVGASTGPGAAGVSTGAGPAAPGSGSPEAAALAFAGCMRANGVPDFPDPSASGGFLFRKGAGVDPGSSAFKAAQSKCRGFLPDIGGPGSGPAISAQALARWLKIAQCMRRHGVPDFPDPRTAAPANPQAALGRGGGVISDIEGAIFVFPGTVDQQSPAFTHAAAACAFPLHNH
jgi:hypothetical protein